MVNENMRRNIRIGLMLVLLLLTGGVANAIKVTYKVINRDGGVAVTSAVQTMTAGDVLSLPATYRTPLIDDVNQHYLYYKGWTEGTNEFSESVSVVPGDHEECTIYVTYDWPIRSDYATDDDYNTALNTILADKNFKENHSYYNIKQGDYYLYQWQWKNDPNAYYQKIGSGDLKNKTITDELLLWEYDFTDPYAILIKSASLNKYMSVGDTYGDIRLYDLETAKTKLLWSFILVWDSTNESYLLMVGNDNFDKNRSTNASQYGGYLMRDATTKARYIKKDDITISDVTMETASTVIPTFSLTKHSGGDPLTVTLGEQSIKSAIELPIALNRKFCNYTFKCEYQENGTYSEGVWHEITTYPALNMDGEGNPLHITIKVEYTVDAGIFVSSEESIPEESWHSLWVNNTPVHRSESDNITTGAIYNVDNQKFALVGDPYEVKLINKGKGTGNYFGVPNASAVGTKASCYTDAAVNKVVWEVIGGSSYTGDEFSLREYGTYNSPKYLGSNTPMVYQSTPTRMRIVDAAHRTVTYHIIRSDDSEAIKSTVKQNEGVTLGYYNLPVNISSPYLEDETLTFYSTTSYSAENIIRTLPSLGGGEDTGYDVYVKYTTSHVVEKPIRLNGKRVFNIAFNSGANYMSTDGSALTNDASPSDLNTLPYYWLLKGEDPYAVQIQSMQDIAEYINFSTPETVSLGALGTDAKFILKSLTTGAGESFTIQLMAATGSETDAEDNYYCLSYSEGFVLSHNVLGLAEDISLSSSLPTVRYHIIDKQHKIVIEKESANDELAVPEEIRSPLVTKWRFWTADAFTVSEEVYTYNGSPTPLNNLAEATSQNKLDIYATYDEADAISTAVQLQTVDPTAKSGSPVARNYNSGYGNMYLLQFTGGVDFYQENASDWFEGSKTKAVYPYTCGDAGMYIYGEKDWTEQLSKGASTRTRWTWYLVSYHETPEFRNDPYHVKITSWQSSHSRTVSDVTTHYYSYFRTYFDDGAGKIITTNVTDDPLVTNYDAENNPNGNPSAVPTEYMVLGTAGNYKLLTVNEIAGGSNNSIDGSRRQVVHSFEQYWKEWETIMKKDVNLSFETNNDIPAESKGAIYSYPSWAYARPTSGGNAGGSKVYEYKSHYFQTIEMGETFHLINVSFSPVLVLLDNHGWEIMRRSIPMTTDTEEQVAEKRAAIRAFDSPLVKTYHWFTQAEKLPGYHKYTPSTPGVAIYAKNASDRWNTTGETYVHTSTTLADLPYDHLLPSQGYGDDGTPKAANDANKQDLYVTYEVKEEFAKTYTSGDSEDDVDAAEYLIYQGSTGYAIATDETTLSTTANANIAKGKKDGITDEMLWYVKPNFNIDKEMGYRYAGTEGASADAISKDEMEAGYVSHTPSNSVYVFDEANGQNGFDPYNIQLQNKKYGTYLTTNAVSAALNLNNDLTSTYDGSAELSLAPMNDDEEGVFTAVGLDQVTLKASNATFMAIQDANGNLRLMPRFDYERVMTGITVLNNQSDAAPAKDRNNTQTADLMRPIQLKYHIIDNEGREAMGYYGRLGEHEPEIPEHFKSPLAKDFKFFNSEVLSEEDEISSTFGEAGVLSTESENDIYVRYTYNDEADVNGILKGKWFTMQLNGKDAKYDNGIKNGSKDATNKAWHWKMLKYPWSTPDPYAVQLFNRNQKDLPMSIVTDNHAYNGTNVGAQSEGTENAYQRFALLSHEDGGYALALAGTNYYEHFYFLNGSSFSSSTAAITKNEPDFQNISGSFDDTGSQILLTDEVAHNYTYKVITNSGALAISPSTGEIAAGGNTYIPTLPESAQSSLLNLSDYLYYEDATGSGPYVVDESTEINNLMGIYDDVVYVRYKAYNTSTTPYAVPNKKDVDGSGNVKKHAESNDIPLSLNAEENRLYNIIWEPDKMMSSNGSTINDGGSQGLGAGTDNAYVWQFDGSDPYAIKIKHKSDKYVDGTDNLNDSPVTTFMLLKKTGYDYGVLQVTGGTNKLSGYGNTLVTDDPTKFIIFALGSSGLIYRLVIANIEGYVEIPYRETKGGDLVENHRINGSTLRNLTSYPISEVNVGAFSLGDQLHVPASLERPNCLYTYYVEGIYDDLTCETPNTDLNNLYKGLAITHLGTEGSLLGKTIKINVVYSFNAGLDSNTGVDFVKSVGTLWYTFETAEGTPYLAHYTYSDGELKGVIGRNTNCTNDYLWTPVGDPYGFRMYNRYVYKNGGETTKVMTTAAEPADNASVIMAALPESSNPSFNYSIYELPVGSNPGCFKVRPLGKDNLYLDCDGGTLRLKTNSTTEWSFGLNIAQLKPYFDRKGYVGGLKQSVCDGNSTLVTAMSNGSADMNQLTIAQGLVYNSENIVSYGAGYYRLHSMPGVSGVSPIRYASGYLHKQELDYNAGAAIPLHFYSKRGVNTTFATLSTGFTSTPATRGDIPIPATEHDPSSIFYFDHASTPRMKTQGLEVLGAKMTGTENNGTQFTVEDIGGAVVSIRSNGSTLAAGTYLNYHQTGNIYELKYETGELADFTKWCMEPANIQGLRVATNDGGDGYYYTSFYAPFDVTIQDDNTNAIICSAWDDDGLTPIFKGANIPSGSPVLIQTEHTTGYVTMQIPSDPLSSYGESNIFKGKYLEQLLASGTTVYVFGLATDGVSGVGFYQNINPNKEAGASTSLWAANNLYVKANKIYYPATPSPARQNTRGVEFVPVVFDDEENEPELFGIKEENRRVYDNRVYDLQGRCVATEEQVKDGTWRQNLRPGIYIINGRKIRL